MRLYLHLFCIFHNTCLNSKKRYITIHTNHGPIIVAGDEQTDDHKEENSMAYVISDDCIACGTCADECPAGAISEGDGKYVIDPDACLDCGTCVAACPNDAISAG